MSLLELKSLALKLPATDRGELVAALMTSLDLPDPNDSGEDSVTEAARRNAELDADAVVAIPEKEFWRQVQAGRR